MSIGHKNMLIVLQGSDLWWTIPLDIDVGAALLQEVHELYHGYDSRPKSVRS